MIGFLSGFLGIGGGVFLGPLLSFLGWAGPKQVAVPLAVAAFLGGLGGATLAERKLSPRVFAVVLMIAAIKAICDAL